MRRKRIECFLCGRHPRKIRRIPLIYPYGTKDMVPICANRHKGVKELRLKGESVIEIIFE